MYADVHPYVNCIYITGARVCVCVCMRCMTNIYVSGESWGIPGSFFVSHSCDTPNIPNK